MCGYGYRLMRGCLPERENEKGRSGREGERVCSKERDRERHTRRETQGEERREGEREEGKKERKEGGRKTQRDSWGKRHTTQTHREGGKEEGSE